MQVVHKPAMDIFKDVLEIKIQNTWFWGRISELKE